MKKRSWHLGLVLLLTYGFLAACSENHLPENSVGDSPPVHTKAITLKFWRNSGNDAENLAYDKLVEQFLAMNPDIKVEMSSFAYSDYDKKLRSSIAITEAPDIMTIDAPNMASYAEAGAILPLTPYFQKDGHLEDIPESTRSAYTYKDRMYMAPLTESSIALFYNKKMFEAKGIPLPSKNSEEPMTWEQVLDAAKKCTDPAQGIYGIDPAQGFQNAGATAYFKYPIIWQFGGEVMSPDGTTSKGYLDAPETVEAIRFYVDLYHKYNVSALEYPTDPFPNGKLAMTIEGSWSLSHYAHNFPDFVLGQDYDIAPLPKGIRQAVANGSWALAISSQSKHADAAWKFVNWITGYDGQKTYVSITKDIPVRYSVSKEISELNSYPKNIFVNQNQLFGRSRPITPIFPQMSEAVNRVFEDTTIGKKPIEASIAQAIKTIDNAYSEFVSRKSQGETVP